MMYLLQVYFSKNYWFFTKYFEYLLFFSYVNWMILFIFFDFLWCFYDQIFSLLFSQFYNEVELLLLSVNKYILYNITNWLQYSIISDCNIGYWYFFYIDIISYHINYLYYEFPIYNNIVNINNTNWFIYLWQWCSNLHQ